MRVQVARDNCNAASGLVVVLLSTAKFGMRTERNPGPALPGCPGPKPDAQRIAGLPFIVPEVATAVVRLLSMGLRRS
jgi:hypothetical protein